MEIDVKDILKGALKAQTKEKAYVLHPTFGLLVVTFGFGKNPMDFHPNQIGWTELANSWDHYLNVADDAHEEESDLIDGSSTYYEWPIINITKGV